MSDIQRAIETMRQLPMFEFCGDIINVWSGPCDSPSSILLGAMYIDKGKDLLYIKEDIKGQKIVATALELISKGDVDDVIAYLGDI